MTVEEYGRPVEQMHRRGRQQFAAMVEGGEERLDALFRAVPALGELAVGVVYGHLHDREALDPRTREAATLAAIVASGMVGPPLSVHVRTGLGAGLAPAEISEVVLQTAAFAGFPRAVSTADALNRLFAELDLPAPPPPSPREVVLDLCHRVRAGEHDPVVTPEVAAAIAMPNDIEVTTTGPHRAVVDCRQPGARDSAALVHATVEDGQVVRLHSFTPTG